MFANFCGVNMPTITNFKLPWLAKFQLACKIPAACINQLESAPAPQ